MLLGPLNITHTYTNYKLHSNPRTEMQGRLPREFFIYILLSAFTCKKNGRNSTWLQTPIHHPKVHTDQDFTSVHKFLRLTLLETDMHHVLEEEAPRPAQQATGWMDENLTPGFQPGPLRQQLPCTGRARRAWPIRNSFLQKQRCAVLCCAVLCCGGVAPACVVVGELAPHSLLPTS